MATTTNYGWTTPDDTALVKDGAAAIRTLGSSIDSTLKTQIDAQIPDALLTTKGDIIAATGASTPARLAVGANDYVLTADSTAAAGVAWKQSSSGAFTQLATGSLSTSTLTLSSISQSYTDLRLVLLDWYPSSNAYLKMTMNGVTSLWYAGYTRTGSTFTSTNYAASFNITAVSEIAKGGQDNNNFTLVEIPCYSNTATNKIVTSESTLWLSSNDPQSQSAAGTWNGGNATGGGTAMGAISSLSITLSAGTFSGGTYILYGVK